MNLFFRFFFGCWSDHEDVRERDQDGKAIYVCRVCGRVQPILASPIVRGPQHQPKDVLGKPTGQAKLKYSEKVTEFDPRRRA